MPSQYGIGNASLKYYASLEAKVHGRLQGHNLEVLKSFKTEDPDGLGQVSKEQFRDVLASFHVPITAEESDIVSVLFENKVGMTSLLLPSERVPVARRSRPVNIAHAAHKHLGNALSRRHVPMCGRQIAACRLIFGKFRRSRLHQRPYRPSAGSSSP